MEKLQLAGATEVVPEALEGSLMLASHALALVGVPMRRVIRIVQDQRDARYNLLRGYFHGADDDTLDEIDHERLTTVGMPMASPLVGQTGARTWLFTPWVCVWSTCAAPMATPENRRATRPS